jgi:DNA-binding winged helix-turn-helix (wHTH) protein
MSRQARHFYEFDSFRLDPDEQVLFRDGEPVPLSPKLFDTLLALVQNSGHIVEKEDLIRQVWPDTFVEENNLSQYVSTLRKALGDERRGRRYIETVPRRGYRFADGVREVWDEGAAAGGATRTKVSLVVKEEAEEEDDSEGRAGAREWAGGKTARGFAAPLPRGPASLALTSLAVAAGVVFGLYQLTENWRPAAGSRAPAALTAARPARGFAIKTFDPSVWPRPDEEIGVEGFVIEDFEDASLVEGLRVELSDSPEGFGPTDKLPTVFNPDVNDTGGGRVFVAGVWDGSRLLINRRSPPPHGYADYAWGDVTFHLPGGASSFGFSLHEMDLNTELSVNGVPQVNVRRLLPSGTTRGGYLRIDAAPGEAIYSVKVANSANDKTGDGLAFDHVAFAPLGRRR